MYDSFHYEKMVKSLKLIDTKPMVALEMLGIE